MRLLRFIPALALTGGLIGCSFLLGLDPLAGAGADGGPLEEGGPPTAAFNLQGCVTSANPIVVVLNWDESSTDATGVLVQRRDTHGAPTFVLVADIDGGATSYSEQVPCWRWQYDYRVTEYNAYGAADAGALVTIFTLNLCDGGTVPDPYPPD